MTGVNYFGRWRFFALPIIKSSGLASLSRSIKSPFAVVTDIETVVCSLNDVNVHGWKSDFDFGLIIYSYEPIFSNEWFEESFGTMLDIVESLLLSLLLLPLKRTARSLLIYNGEILVGINLKLHIGILVFSRGKLLSLVLFIGMLIFMLLRTF